MLAEAYLAFLGDLAAFYRDYAIYLAGGGNPDLFAGLPVAPDFPAFAAALNAYALFLQAGGLPSGYLVLDAATIAAYLEALAALEGGLAGPASLDPFFVDYFIFISGGGDPDQFAGLPINGGGGNGGGGPNEPPVPPMLAGYTGGFDAVAPRVNFILGGERNGGAFVGSESGFSASAYTLEADGGLASYTRDPGGQVRNRGAAQQTDIFGNADAVIGRWTNGSISIPNTFTFNANQGLHYLLTRPVGPGFVPTLMGRVDYYLIGATRPTIANGSLAPGVFDAGMAILLSGDYRLAMEGAITMPNGSNPYIVSFGTTGGLEDPSRSDVTIGFNTIGAFFASIRGTDNAGNCNGNPDLCVFNLRGTVAGDEDTIGITYDARTGTTATAIVGAAIFEAGPMRTFSGGGGNGGGCAGSGCTMSLYGGFGGANPHERLGLVYQIFPGNFSLPRIQGAVIYAPVGTMVPAAASNAAAALDAVADPADRSAVIRQAEQLMGGMITFGRAAHEPR